jgi:hypothetical protein
MIAEAPAPSLRAAFGRLSRSARLLNFDFRSLLVTTLKSPCFKSSGFRLFEIQSYHGFEEYPIVETESA